MARLVFHVLHGPEDAALACIPFVQAAANKERGDEVEIILAGDAVVLVKDNVIDGLVAPGCPPLRETFAKLMEHAVPIHV